MWGKRGELSTAHPDRPIWEENTIKQMEQMLVLGNLDEEYMGNRDTTFCRFSVSLKFSQDTVLKKEKSYLKPKIHLLCGQI